MLEIKEISSLDEEVFCKFEKRYKEEAKGEPIPYSLNPKNLTFSEFLIELEKCKHMETLPQGFVLAKYYLIYVDGRIVGGINLRYQDNDFILNCAGHIGYGIAPWERNKGYAKGALKKVLIEAKHLGMNQCLLTTDLDNIASQSVILSCGGVFEKRIEDKNLYWITLGEWKKEESAMAIVFYKKQILSTIELIYGKEVLSCPKGHIEKNETHIETAIRECFEETNVILKKEDYIVEVEPYTIQFVDHHNDFISKTIYPVCFCINQKGNPLSKEERVLSIQYMDIEDFLLQCSYDNVKTMVRNSLRMIDL